MSGLEALFAAGTVGGGITTTAALNTALATGAGLGTIGASTLAPTIASWAVPAAMTIAGGGIQAAASIQQGNALRAAGMADQAALDRQAAILNQNAGQARAGAHRQAAEERRRGKLVASRAMALGAASGAGGDGLVGIVGDIEAETAFREGMALYEGEDQARVMEEAARGRTYEGAQAATAGKRAGWWGAVNAASTIAGSAGTAATLYSKYR